MKRRVKLGQKVVIVNRFAEEERDAAVVQKRTEGKAGSLGVQKVALRWPARSAKLWQFTYSN
jgi:hypothetical protein